MRFSMNFKANLKKGLSSDALIGDAIAVATAGIYGGLPTLLNLNGPLALAVGAGVPFVAGKLLDVPEMCHASLALAAFHVLQNNQDVVAKVLGKPLWLLDNSGTNGLAEAVQPGASVESFNGQPVVAYGGGTALPEGQGISDRLIPIGELTTQSLFTGNQNSIFNRRNSNVFAH